jgi:F-type H+-transporting ATPase subunit b
MNFLSNLTSFASAATESGEKADILTSLGIDFKLLVLQLIAFLILVVLLAKYVYPVFLRIIDEREAKIEESTKAAEAAGTKAAEAENKIKEVLKAARSEAADIVATAKAEATSMVEKAESDAKKRSERIIAEAQEGIEKDIIAAREVLRDDTLRLVKEATGIVTAHVADSKLDSALIKKSLEEAK